MSSDSSHETGPRRAIIEGSARTIASAIPMIGGPIAQAWSEYTNYKQSARTDAFVSELRAHVADLERRHVGLKEAVEALPDGPELLERCIEAARREASDRKRPLYSRAYSRFLEMTSSLSPDERTDIVQDIEQLTERDLEVLFWFRGGVPIRGDALTGTVTPGFAAFGGDQVDRDDRWLETHGPLVHSLAKLVGRGLVIETIINAGFSHSGDSGSEFNRFRRRAWKATPIGIRFLKSVISQDGKRILA